jgi:glutathione transport system ATP-binding protein
MDEKRIVEAVDLKIHFPLEDNTVKAVDGISFHIDRGETLAVVGESGSGKSVTAMGLMRLNDYAGGKIVGGSARIRQNDGTVVDISKADQEEMRLIRGNNISMIFQEPMTSLNPVFTVGFQIMEPIMLHQGKTEDEARETALEMLRLVRIPEPEKQMQQYPHHLSGGMRQRVMIAMALSCRPDLLIADEPTTALDVTIQAQILDLIRHLQKEIGMAVMFITHDMGVVAEMADRVLVMYKGNVMEEGSIDQIFHAPEHPYTKTLLSAVPKLGSMQGKDQPEPFPDIVFDESFKAVS